MCHNNPGLRTLFLHASSKQELSLSVKEKKTQCERERLPLALFTRAFAYCASCFITAVRPFLQARSADEHTGSALLPFRNN